MGQGLLTIKVKTEQRKAECCKLRQVIQEKSYALQRTLSAQRNNQEQKYRVKFLGEG